MRRALCAAIDRAAIIEAAPSAGISACFSTIPSNIGGDWSAQAHAFVEDVDQANAALGAAGAVAVPITVNDSARQITIATKVTESWEALDGDGSSSIDATTTAVAWTDFLAIYDTSHDYSVIRMALNLESNNLLPQYEMIAGAFSSPDAGFESLLSEARNDMASGDWTAFDADLVALNDYLVDNALVMPIHQY